MKKILIVIGVIILVALGYYLISPIFRNVKVDEAVPISKTEKIVTPSKEGEGVKSADVNGSSGHPASGQVKIIKDEINAYIRYENFKTINGPDIYVYLAKDLDAKDYVSLGKVKATEGNINYKIPVGVNIKDYKYVMVWCKTFGVLFNYADISGL